jgi:hypothetical protein
VLGSVSDFTHGLSVHPRPLGIHLLRFVENDFSKAKATVVRWLLRGGEGEIRTLDTLRYARFPGECTRPLCDLSTRFWGMEERDDGIGKTMEDQVLTGEGEMVLFLRRVV